MQRGESVKELPEPWCTQFSSLACLPQTDLFHPNNIGYIGGKLHFIDYGDPSADEILPLLFGEHQSREYCLAENGAG